MSAQDRISFSIGDEQARLSWLVGECIREIHRSQLDDQTKISGVCATFVAISASGNGNTQELRNRLARALNKPRNRHLVVHVAAELVDYKVDGQPVCLPAMIGQKVCQRIIRKERRESTTVQLPPN